MRLYLSIKGLYLTFDVGLGFQTFSNLALFFVCKSSFKGCIDVVFSAFEIQEGIVERLVQLDQRFAIAFLVLIIDFFE